MTLTLILSTLLNIMPVLKNYYAFENVSRDYDDAIGDSFVGFDFSQEPNNYCSDDEICNEVTDFKDSKKWLKSLIKL